MRKGFRVSLVLVCLVAAIAVRAQSNYGVISGSVLDAQRLPIAGATIELTAASTGAVRRVVTNQQGIFEAPALLPDEYELKTQAAGFAAATQSVRLEVGQKLAVEVALAVGAITQGVNVVAG